MGGACGTYGREERCIQGFGGETWGKVTTWKDNNKVDFWEIGWEEENWIRLAQDRNKRREYGNEPSGCIICGEFVY